jgi:hypothetical protein
MNSTIIELLVNAERLGNAILNEPDLRLLLENEDVIGRWADYEDKLREVVTSGTLKDFDSTVKYLEEESKFLKDKKSPKHKIVDSHIEKLKSINRDFIYAFMHWQKEIDKYRKNELLDDLSGRVAELDNALKAAKSKLIIAAAQKYDIKEGLSLLDLDEVDPHTFKFIRVNKNDFKNINPKSIKNTDGYLKKYKDKYKKYPENVEQLKEFRK